MQYIILDLEWNQPINYQNRIYRLYGDRLIFEMIQIGAVRVDEHLNILDSISIPIQPTCYTVIHPRIRSMTHLSEQVLDTAPYFEEALNSFLTWCGTDCIFLTWGCDDVSVFQQNLDFFELHPDLPAFYDIQPLFASAFGMTQRMNLPGAMDLMGLSQEDDKYFHNAAHDAYYTAQVFIHLPHPEEILHYPQQPRSLLHPASKARKTDLFETIAQGLESELAQSPRCAICAKATEIDGPYVPQSGGKFIGLSRCKKHGVMLVRIQFRPVQDHMQTMMVKTVKASRTNIAYIHTKQFQLRERLASEHGELGDLEMERMAPAYSPIDG